MEGDWANLDQIFYSHFRQVATAGDILLVQHQLNLTTLWLAMNRTFQKLVGGKAKICCSPRKACHCCDTIQF